MIKFFLASAAMVLAAGCASSVNLNDVPVEDRQGASVSGSAADAAAAGQVAARSGVEGVGLESPADRATKALGNTSPVIYFDYDSAALKPEFLPAVEAYAGQLKQDGRRTLQVEGHTDDAGGREYNLALGQRRADAVRQALVRAGAQERQVETVSYGKEKPAASGNDDASRAENRRAVIIY